MDRFDLISIVSGYELYKAVRGLEKGGGGKVAPEGMWERLCERSP